MNKYIKSFSGNLSVDVNKQGSTNCAHGEECARNLHAKKISRARNYVQIKQSKHF